MENGGREIYPGNALVTGGGRGIGREIATRLAGEGYTVAAASRSAEDLDGVVAAITESGGRARAFPTDLTEPDAIEALVDDLERELGHVDVLVNNAGIARGGDPLWDVDPEAWWRVFELNLRAPMLLSHHLLKGMLARGAGYVINLGSLGGARPGPRQSAYSASKAALARLGDSLAGELAEGEHGVSVFTVSPGLVRTDMTAGVPVFEDLQADAWTPVEAIGELVVRLTDGEFDALSGRFLHVGFDLERMRDDADEIVDRGLYVLRLPSLDGLVE